MSDFTFAVEGGHSVRLKTAGKYCPRDIVVTAKGSDDSFYDQFWDAYQNSGGYVFSYAGAFGSSRWTDEVYNPKYPIVCSGGYSMERLFYNSAITDTKVPITAYNGIFITGMFTNSKLKTIRKLVLENTDGVKTGNSFDNCTDLQNITIEGVLSGQSGRTDPNFQWSPLTKASIKNVIACLSDTSVEVTATFQKTAVNAAFTTDEWNALVASKPNWTITLA